jgi:arsenite methyltransferase
MTDSNVRETVKKRYGEAAQVAAKGQKASCCSPLGNTDPITRDLYADAQTIDVPAEAMLASLGCGNPTALAELHAGEVVLDLGSGGGIDVFLSARRVGPTGKAFGLDMTPEMLALARENQKKAGVENVEFLEGTIENIPLPDASVDVIISNCVINLSTDKDAVLREVFRVLKPGGRFAVSDIVLRRELPPEVQKSMELWTGCVAGALVAEVYEQKLRDAGFSSVDIEPTRVYTKQDADELLSSSSGCCCGGGAKLDVDLGAIDGAVMSAFVRATKG